MKKIIIVLLAFLLVGLIAAPANARVRFVPHGPMLKFVSVAVAGDSTSAQPNSWMHQITGRIYLSGGFQHGGYTSTRVLAAMPVNERADVLVVKVGTNDFRFGRSVRQVIHTVWQIVAKGNADHVILSAIVPCNETHYLDSRGVYVNRAALGAELNRALKATAKAHGWVFVDPDSFRTARNHYKTGMTRDGVHPTTKAYKLEAAALVPAILAVSR